VVGNAVGGILWACAYGFGTHALGDQIKRISGPAGIVTAVLGLAACVAAVLFIRRHEKRLIATISTRAAPQFPGEGSSPS
jgi:membrane protein DedA with SNARE-associated domain